MTSPSSVADRASPSPSVSLASTLPVMTVSSLPVAVSATALGAVFAGVIVTSIVVVLVAVSPLEASWLVAATMMEMSPAKLSAAVTCRMDRSQPVTSTRLTPSDVAVLLPSLTMKPSGRPASVTLLMVSEPSVSVSATSTGRAKSLPTGVKVKMRAEIP